MAPKQEVKPAVKETKPVTQAKPAVQTPVTQAPTAPVVPATPTPVATQQPVQTQAPAVAPTSTQQTDTPKPATGNRAGDKLISAGLFLGAILAILAFFLKVIKSLAKTNNQRFDAAFANQPKPQQPNSYNEITEDTDLNWQEKYQKFLGETERQPEQARRGNGNYQFITANDEVEEKRQSLERLLEPETVPTVEEDEITFIDNDAYAINEEDFIGKSLKREFKLKAFANPLSDANPNRIEKII